MEKERVKGWDRIEPPTPPRRVKLTRDAFAHVCGAPSKCHFPTEAVKRTHGAELPGLGWNCRAIKNWK